VDRTQIRKAGRIYNPAFTGKQEAQGPGNVVPPSLFKPHSFTVELWEHFNLELCDEKIITVRLTNCWLVKHGFYKSISTAQE
jgi:hypothetical protein